MKKSKKERKREERERKEEEERLKEVEVLNLNFMTEEKFRQVNQFEDNPSPSFWKHLGRELTCTRETFFNIFPIARWLLKYKFKQDIFGDLVAGITVAVMHIPHGLAYAPLGYVEPVAGFYMAIFPVFVYIIMGTSRHLSIGTFAVMCAMAGQSVAAYSPFHVHPEQNEISIGNHTHPVYHPEIVASTVCILVGFWQLLMGLFNIGSLTVIMSESLISGFTTGAACHVFTYQFKHLLGLDLLSFEGKFRILYIYSDIVKKIRTVNSVTMIISFVSITILLLNHFYFKKLLIRKVPKCKVPVPVELLLIIASILISNFAKLTENYDVKIVGYIPSGFPQPIFPSKELIVPLLLHSFVLALVAMAVNMSLAKMFAKKNNYAIHNNQELVAYGLANIFGSFFRCLPTAASLSRSTIQYSVGGKTQLTSFFSLIIITCILLVAGVLFERTPYCVLSSIVSVTLLNLIMQAKDLPRIWRRSPSDGIIWLGTFVCVIIFDLDVGLLFGIILSGIRVAFHAYRLEMGVLGRLPNSNLFVDVNNYKQAQQIPKVLILKVGGNLNYTNTDSFDEFVIKKFNKFHEENQEQDTFIILNMSAVTRIDPNASSDLIRLYAYFRKFNCELYLTDVSPRVYRAFTANKVFKQIPKKNIFPSVIIAIDRLKDLK